MSEVIDIGAKTPCQKRSIGKMQLVLFATEHLILAEGVEETSIPKIAERANVPRSFIYNYFPTKYDLISKVTEMHFEKMVLYVFSAVEKNRTSYGDWQQLVDGVINAAAFYFNNHMLSSKLVFGGPYSRSDMATEEKTVSVIALRMREALARFERPLLIPESPDVASFAVEIGLAIMRYSYFIEGAVTQAAVDEAKHALTAYLVRWQRVSPFAATQAVNH